MNILTQIIAIITVISSILSAIVSGGFQADSLDEAMDSMKSSFISIAEEVAGEGAEAEAEAVAEEDYIYFPEASEDFVKAKQFMGYYILMDSEVIFALNEDETRFAVKFYGMGGNRLEYMEGEVTPEGIVYVDGEYNGLYGEDVQTMYEDALEEKTDWLPIKR